MQARIPRAALIGGSGFIGHALVHALARHGWRATVACRRVHRARELLIHQTRLVPANVATGKGLDAAMRDAQVAFYLVGLLYEKGSQTFQAAHVDGVARAIEAAKRAGIERFIFISALGAGKIPESRYATTKAEGEQMVRESGLRWTIVRPSVVYGARDQFLQRFRRMAEHLPFLPLVGGKTKMQPIWVEDLARALFAMIDDPHAVQATIEIGGPEQWTLKAMIEEMLRVLGMRRTIIELAPPIARLAATIGEWLPRPPLTRDQLVLLAHDNVIDTDEPYPARYGRPARFAEVLPRVLFGAQAEIIQRKLDEARRSWRNLNLMPSNERRS